MSRFYFKIQVDASLLGITMDVLRTILNSSWGNQVRHYVDALTALARAFWRTQQGNWAVVASLAGYCEPATHYLSLATVLAVFLLRHSLGSGRTVYAVRRSG